MSFNYSLHTILPFAPAAVRPLTTNFEIRSFMNNLFEELEKAHVPGVVKMNPPSNLYISTTTMILFCPDELRRASTGSMSLSSSLSRIDLTGTSDVPRGVERPALLEDATRSRMGEWCGDHFPEDGTGYMRHLSSLVPSLDPVIHQVHRRGARLVRARELFLCRCDDRRRVRKRNLPTGRLVGGRTEGPCGTSKTNEADHHGSIAVCLAWNGPQIHRILRDTPRGLRRCARACFIAVRGNQSSTQRRCSSKHRRRG